MHFLVLKVARKPLGIQCVVFMPVNRDWGFGTTYDIRFKERGGRTSSIAVANRSLNCFFLPSPICRRLRFLCGTTSIYHEKKSETGKTISSCCCCCYSSCLMCHRYSICFVTYSRWNISKVSEAQNPSLDVSELHKISASGDFVAWKLLKYSVRI